MKNQPLNSSDHSKILIFSLLLAPSVVFGVGAIPALLLGFGVFMLKKNEDFSHIETAVKTSKVYITLLLTGCVLAVLYLGSSLFMDNLQRKKLEVLALKEYALGLGNVRKLEDGTFTVTENGNVIYVANEQKAHSYRAYSLAYDKSISEPGSTYFENIYGNGKINFIVSVILSGIALTYLILIKTLFLNPLKSHSEWIEKNGIFSSKSKSSISQLKTSDINIMKSEKLKQYSVADELLKWTKLKDGGHISEDEFNEAREKILKRN